MKRSTIRFAMMGSRNNELFNFAMKLVDEKQGGQYVFDEDAIKHHLNDVNGCLDHPVPNEEIDKLVRLSVKRKIGERE